ncbi:F0F1 ATP synthase subunit epsilon [Paenibacillus sp. CMAA1739]|uniref:F0F1 ATP synthase subunit epsilon n=1 Tax=Paenibacillus ottowii TaxID=2315729 RepID=UPI0011B1C27A|nr:MULTISPECIES: F0F1 ATP synthase subunit epsilon [Paenibacillus]MDP1510270.1 F0F1 ATP synthase subunit epsilon [Paenibacillus ottowii]MEC4565686.1 F0F1 ATP synthase subunit epsilon [Paenibacillus sp. CMAA1739]QDY84463.1 F0F1 ATP synthase subunit epsilon [Paenibacillus polymyxa]
MSTYLLEIVTPERLVYTEQVNSISVRGSEGDLGILPGHLPLVTPLKIAPVRIKIGGQTEVIAVNGGFIEVRKDKVVILAESAERSEDIDVERARAARERAELRLQSKQDQIDHHRAEVALQRALNRLNAISIRTNKN